MAISQSITHELDSGNSGAHDDLKAGYVVTVSPFVLGRWRSLDAHIVLGALADYAKQDRTFNPRKDCHTTRWHAFVAGHDVELVCTGRKFFDTRARRGGSGAIDMVMHLYNIDFKAAITQLQTKPL